MRIMDEMWRFCNLLMAKYWQIYISREGNFITTDTPYLDIPLSDKFWGNDFLAREQVFILSPRVVIIARDPKSLVGKKIHRNDITGNKGKISMVNCHNLMNAISFGFHKDKTLLLETEKMVIIMDHYYDNVKKDTTI